MTAFHPEFAMLRFLREEFGDEAVGLEVLPARFAGPALHALGRVVANEPAAEGDAAALIPASDVLGLIDFHQVPLRCAWLSAERAAAAADAAEKEAWVAALRERFGGVKEPLDWVPLRTVTQLRYAAFCDEDRLVRLDETGPDLRCVGPPPAVLGRALSFPAPLDPVDTSASVANLRAGMRGTNYPALLEPPQDPRGVPPDAEMCAKDMWRMLEEILRAFPGEVVLAGGFVASLLCPRLRNTRTHDADVFVHGATPARATEIANAICDFCTGCGRVTKSRNACTVFSCLPIQIVLRTFRTREDVLRSFDIAACRALIEFDAATGRLEASATESFCAAVRQGAVWVDLAAVDSVPTYTARLLKYAMKGFRILVPGLSRSAIAKDATLRTTNPSPDVTGLRLLLMIEWMVNHAPGKWFRRWQVAASDATNVVRFHLPPSDDGDLVEWGMPSNRRDDVPGLMVYVNCYMTARATGLFYGGDVMHAEATVLEEDWTQWRPPESPCLAFFEGVALHMFDV